MVRRNLDRLIVFIAGHRVKSGPTPVDVKLVEHEQVFIAVLGDMLGVIRFLPRPDGRSQAFITLSRHPALSPE